MLDNLHAYVTFCFGNLPAFSKYLCVCVCVYVEYVHVCFLFLCHVAHFTCYILYKAIYLFLAFTGQPFTTLNLSIRDEFAY